MHNRGLYAVAILSGMLALASGCRNKQIRPVPRPVRGIAPPGIAGTVAEYADLVGNDSMPVRGYGVVVGLGDAGSAEVPTHLRKRLIQQMLKYGIGSPIANTAHLPPARMLADKDTAVVVIHGYIPPAAPVGTHFDFHVEALPRTQTASLEGGILMSTEMYLAMAGAGGGTTKAKTWAIGRGAIFVNPFTDRTTQSGQARLRTGRVLNGAVVTRSQPVRLELRRADYRISRLIQRRLNQRFGGAEKVAVAKTPSMIELRIPRSRRRDYGHLLKLMMHVCISDQAGGQERLARQLTGAILLPTARYEDIALTWEAMGREILPIIHKLYASENPAAAFYAARTGLRLNDTTAADAMIRIAMHASSPFQIPAISELGRARHMVQGLKTLERMLSDSNELLRVAAYEALIEHGSNNRLIRRHNISDQFTMDVVETAGNYVIYTTVTGAPKIVLFGRDIPVNRPVFYCPDHELVTINASRTDKNIMLYRKLPGATMRSESFYIAPRADELIKTLGLHPNRGPDGRIEGMGLTYSQIVGVLQGLCKGECIPARFVLQRSDELRKIYRSVPAAGRPDMPTSRPGATSKPMEGFAPNSNAREGHRR